MSATSVNITPPLQCFSSVNITGDLTANNMYNKTEIDNLIANAASSQNVYTKVEVNNLLNDKRNNADSYTITEVK